ncbi:MAG: efflux RND transporter periplasmic adaptor subunit [Candidatus Acidiferrales bacterium]
MDTNTTTTAVPNPPSSSSPEHRYSDRSGEPKSHWWVWLLIGVLIVGGALIYYRHRQAAAEAAAKAKASQQPRAVPIVAATARKGDIGVYVEALGAVTPVYTVNVTSRVQGQVMNVFYREGQMVRKGDPLLEIDPRPFQAALTQVEGQLEHDEAVLAEARIDLERYQAAFSRNAIAKQQLDDQTQAVKQDEGTVKNDQGQVANAQVNLVYTRITSPIDGRVGLRLIDPGNMVQANGTTPLVVVTQLTPITVIFSVAEDYLSQIQLQLRHGNKLTVDALDRAQEKKIAQGTLLTLDNQIDTTTGTVKLRAIFPNSDGALFPNQFVNARLLVETQRDVTLVPTAGIQRNAQGPFVYLITDQKATLRTVKVGTTDGNITAIEGINPGDVIAVNGFDKLQDGLPVTIRKPAANGNANANSNEGTGETP